MSDYGPNPEMVWNGVTQGLGGTYTGLRAIDETFEGFMGATSSFSVDNETWRTTPIGSDSALVNSTFSFNGENGVVGSFSGAVVGRDYYSQVDGGWYISQEDWNFTSFNVQYAQTSMFGLTPSDVSCYP